MRTVPADRKGMVEAIETLTRGGLVIVPTETFYGIACNPHIERAVDRLINAKGREAGKPIPLLAGSMESVLDVLTYSPPLLQEFAARFWPGPLTLVLPAAHGFHPAVTAGTGTVGVRIPGPSFAHELAATFGSVVTGTSANPSGTPPPTGVEEIDPALVEIVDLIVSGGRTPGGEPSTVLDITVSPPRILREGVLGSQIRAFLHQSL